MLSTEYLNLFLVLELHILDGLEGLREIPLAGAFHPLFFRVADDKDDIADPTNFADESFLESAETYGILVKFGQLSPGDGRSLERGAFDFLQKRSAEQGVIPIEDGH